MKKVHFIGISGIGMSGVALFANDLGYNVSGSSDQKNDRVDLLQRQGIDIHIGHKKENIRDPDICVFTTAVSDDNPEIMQANKKKIGLLSRLDFLKLLIKESKKDLIGITGTDGKTSTTAMVGHILIRHGMDPTILLGGLHKDLEFGNYRRGSGPLVAEIDESDGYFKNIKSQIAVLTNLRGDHLEHYKDDLKHYTESMITFIKNAQKGVVPCDLEDIPKNSVCFSPTQYDAYSEINEKIKDIYTKVNLVCAVKTCEQLMIKPEKAIAYLNDFENVDRRMTIRLQNKNLLIVDDYAHTPKEIEFSIKAVSDRYRNKKMIIVFEAHRYTRLKRDMKMFAQTLSNPLIEELIVMPVYSAYEKEEPKIFEDFKFLLEERGRTFTCITTPDDIIHHIAQTEDGEIVLLMMGAGKSSEYSKKVAEICTKKELFFT
ncbi:MAG: UDP-N-acetylmuramate--alanine ligase [Thermotogaceae bacterium]|nr:UDP-N-acetylmuramate--alanine ligase [Thermotogaceae bacterium]